MDTCPMPSSRIRSCPGISEPSVKPVEAGMLIIDVMDDNGAENWSASEMIEEKKRLMAALNQTSG